MNPHELYGLIKWIFILSVILFTGFLLQKKHNWNPLYLVLAGIVLILFYYIQYTTYKYHPFLYATLLPMLSVLSILVLSYYFFERQYIKRVSEIEKNTIKTKLSRDLHDDLAATVSSIGFYLTLIKFQIKEKNTKISGFIQKSENLLQEATDAITDLIWAINPKPETLASLITRIAKNYRPLFQEQSTLFKIPKEASFAQTTLKDNIKQNIFLIIKETLNNILKYAEATHVSIAVKKEKKVISIRIQDNGKGFDYETVKNKGNGLINMQKRAAEIGATLSINSNKGEGTSIDIVFSS